MVNARLCETARLAFFFASPRHFESGSICHKINFRGIFMVKANHIPRCVKENLRNTKNVVGNFVIFTGGRYGKSILDLYGST